MSDTPLADMVNSVMDSKNATIDRLERDLAAANSALASKELALIEAEAELQDANARIAELEGHLAKSQMERNLEIEARLAELERANEWHKASEHPNTARYVLVETDQGGDPSLGFYIKDSQWPWRSNNNGTVLRWRELPQPPKEAN